MSKCKTCRWFINPEETDRKKVKGYGECRKGSPISYHADAPWPTVHEEDWCGEYSPKPQENK